MVAYVCSPVVKDWIIICFVNISFLVSNQCT